MTRYIIIVLVVVLILAAAVFILKPGKEAQTEEELIEAWIIENNLNQYGDPKDTVYTGGTPLFDEKTGQTIDKYEYILRRHPDKPWLK